jgi:hypothetical protein
MQMAFHMSPSDSIENKNVNSDVKHLVVRNRNSVPFRLRVARASASMVLILGNAQRREEPR